ncbi:alpha/beta hydrolase [Frankia sp. CNm7]|uniref:Alpha/beta hydrolase n=1 Tax=Frankia nepalensis TaxID=1836974 RepID=A0A937URB0_9ACTN|nr:alpha/beta hydrolase [Frankia nepalensis]MBL7501170.1 alpha/beta hydrolase [Frankia nepalensis]MBL7512628.1 alpha/beta hydrolase [Frankia nepalensis]MBL7520889.1 alpha/beta hydrolase [Frankia nepalensis]MBL7632684.1 alpha/beta hydrolase [Frankia nepalensis]
MPFADVGDVRLFYTDEGAGDPPLLLVHGYSADSHDWSWQLPHLVANHRVIAVDLRGHGRSSVPQAGYTAAQFVADLVGLLDGLSVDRVVAFGHSMGGIVASGLAVEHPDRVAAVVAVDPAYLLPDETADGIRPLLDLLAETDPAPIIQQLIGRMESPAQPPALRTWQLRRIAGMEGHVLRQALEAQVTGLVLRSNSEPYLSRRACPVLTFYADPTRADAERAVFADTRSRVVTWEGAGHWLHQERSAEFNALVTSWLASLA